MGPGLDPNSYSVKEILTMFVLPDLAEIKEAATKHETRIGSLETWRARFTGALALVSVAIPVAVVFIK